MFDTMNAQDLNTRLKDLMDGLSVKARPPATSLLSRVQSRCLRSWAPLARSVCG